MNNDSFLKNRSVGIIGFGRFGKVLANLLVQDYEVKIYDIYKNKNSEFTFCDFDTILQENILFIAVPIRQFENTIQSIAKKILPGTTIIDVCSVKVYPVKIMQSYLKNNEIIATHPLFGPDSIRTSKNLNIMMNNVSAKKENYENWKSFFNAKKINVIEMSPEEHDQQAAQSQCITHFIGRTLEKADLKKVTIDTHGFKQLMEIKQQTCLDSWELFEDLHRYNPYSKDAITKLEKAFKEIIKKV